MNLNWTPWGASTVSVIRNGTPFTQTANDGAYTDRNGAPGDTYELCDASVAQSPETCTNVATAQ